ncbi:DJ-1/PfpI family protein [Enterobacter roggenkampii]|uniref:DJ-1/PfpI family protein n=1 Tax=Enterobacter roggenkampii TaxID=1812935 RepID=UPI002A83F52F|nr:DJ-1/PfpI family protein [Enterobacter roggenkampii]
MTALNFIGPLAGLSSGGFNINYVWHEKEPLDTESLGIKIYPSETFSEVRSADLLCVPGTSNPFDIINDHKAMEGLNYVGSCAEYVTSICTGSIILQAAGLLNGYRAVTHWSMQKQLYILGATVARDRVVADRNRIRGGGVIAGIDFGLTLLSTLKDEDNTKSHS